MAKKRKRKYKKKNLKYWGEKCNLPQAGDRIGGKMKKHKPTVPTDFKDIKLRTTSLMVMDDGDELRLYRMYHNLDKISCNHMSDSDRKLLNVARNDIEELLK